MCVVGTTGPDGGPCLPCAAGTHKPQPGPGKCTDCVAGTYAATMGSAECQRCPTNSNASAASTNEADCVCAAGFWGALRGRACEQCAAGTHRPQTTTPLDCVACSIGEVSTLGFTACREPMACPDWDNDLADAVTALLLMPSNTTTEEDKQESLNTYELFAAHYVQQTTGSPPPACIALYNRVLARMRSDTGSSAATTLVYTVDVGILTLGLFAFVFIFT